MAWKSKSRIAVAAALLILAAPPADAGCFLFFCPHHRHIARQHTHRVIHVHSKLIVKKIVKTKVIVKEKVIVKQKATPADKPLLPPFPP